MKLPTMKTAAAIILLIASIVGYVTQSIKINHLGEHAALIMRGLNQSVINDKTVGDTIEAAIAIVSRNPRAAVVHVLSLGYSVWSHFTHGDELRRQLEEVSAQLGTEARWRGFWIFLGIASIMATVILRLRARRISQSDSERPGVPH